MGEEAFSGLESAPGFGFPVFTSAGLAARAQPIARRCERARDHLASALDVTPPETCLLALAPGADWEAYGDFPVYVFGMPHCPDERTLVVAGEANTFWRVMTPPLADLSIAERVALWAAYGADPFDASPFFDLLAVHELTHLFLAQRRGHYPRHWLDELFCNLALHTFVAEREPEALPALEALPRAVVAAPAGRLTYRRLDDLERFYTDMEGANYGWYQCELHAAAARLYQRGSVALLQRYWAALRPGPTASAASDTGMDALLVAAGLPEVAEVARDRPA